MTWPELFRRAWRVLRVRFARQHICPDCGDAMTRRREYERLLGYWYCADCDEQAERARAEQIKRLGIYRGVGWDMISARGGAAVEG